MHLAYLVSRFPSVSHTFVLREVLALRAAGVRVDTYTVRRPSADYDLSRDDREARATTEVLVPPLPRELVAAHMTALLTRPHRYFGTLRLALSLRAAGARSALWQIFYFGEAALMWRKCMRSGARHIHAHHANVGSDVAMLATHLGGPGWSWSFTMHGPTELFDVREHRLAQKTERAHFVVCISEYARSQLMGLVATEHWSKLHVVHCGVDVRRFAAVSRNGRPAALEILNVGRVVPVKGQSLLVEALAELRRRGIDARLTIVGDGPQAPELRELTQRLGVEDRVEFAGAVGQDAILDYYERADVFAAASFAEGLPVVLMEAMATGLPVVASRIAGVPELVEDGVSGYLVAPGRVDELVAALERIATADPKARAAVGAAGREKVVAEFAIDRTAEDLLKVFRATTASPPSGARP